MCTRPELCVERPITRRRVSVVSDRGPPRAPGWFARPPTNRNRHPTPSGRGHRLPGHSQKSAASCITRAALPPTPLPTSKTLKSPQPRPAQEQHSKTILIAAHCRPITANLLPPRTPSAFIYGPPIALAAIIRSPSGQACHTDARCHASSATAPLKRRALCLCYTPSHYNTSLHPASLPFSCYGLPSSQLEGLLF